MSRVTNLFLFVNSRSGLDDSAAIAVINEWLESTDHGPMREVPPGVYGDRQLGYSVLIAATNHLDFGRFLDVVAGAPWGPVTRVFLIADPGQANSCGMYRLSADGTWGEAAAPINRTEDGWAPAPWSFPPISPTWDGFD